LIINSIIGFLECECSHQAKWILEDCST